MLEPHHSVEPATWRILDANINRAQEALRTLEDYARFAHPQSGCQLRLKEIRHRLATAADRLNSEQLLASREVRADIGRTQKTISEVSRQSLQDVARAAAKRAEQALRCLEEYAKLVDSDISSEFEQLRYQVYDLECNLFQRRADRITRLESAQLYVLIDGQSSADEFARCVELAVTAEVDVLQLRDKRLSERELWDRAQQLRRLTSNSHTLGMMNDRIDIALAAELDGVHLGQEDLPATVMRRVGPELLLGVSTHALDQARQAVNAGADYLGCGPTFPSGTKSFSSFPGTDYLSQVSSTLSTPGFAIGGITPDNLDQVLATGIRRIAVQGAIWKASDPVAAIRQFQQLLQATTDPPSPTRSFSTEPR